jgi:threonine/homoserine/homoserine lactone efflux protein
MKKRGSSLVSDLMGAMVTIRVVIFIFVVVLLFFAKFPPAFLVLLLLGLAYSIYRIFKDLKAVRSKSRARANSQLS